MKKQDSQVCLKLAGTLRAHLEEEAVTRRRSLSNLIRQILIDHTAQRIVTAQREAA
jgi:hypothetical protein